MTTYKSHAGLMMLMAVTLFTAGAAAYGQSDQVFKDEPTETRVIHLAHARASQVSDVVARLFVQCAIGVDHRTNSIITNCPSDKVKALVDLIAQLDVESGQEYEQVFLQVASVSSGLREMLNAALSDGSRLAIDPDSGTVGIWGTIDDIRRAREVIALLDANRKSTSDQRDPEKRSSYRVHLYYVTAQYGESDSVAELPSLPAKLDSVGKTLIENGFQQLGLLASMLVLSHPDDGFQMEGSVDLSQMGDASKIEVEVEGNLFEDEGDRVQLELRTRLIQKAIENPSCGGSESLFELNTTIQCGLDEYLVLSASPAGAKLFDAVALVIHVTR